MARVFRPTYPKMRTIKDRHVRPVMEERIAECGKHNGKKRLLARREPERTYFTATHRKKK